MIVIFNEFSNKLAQLVLLGKTVSIPSAYYLGLSTTSPNADGTNITEPSKALGYDRVEIAPLSPSLNGMTANVNAIEYNTATGKWGIITYAIFYDELGNPCFASSLDNPLEVNAGDIFRINSGGIRFGFGDT